MLVPTALAVAKALVEVASKVTVMVGVLVPTVVALEDSVGVMVEVFVGDGVNDGVNVKVGEGVNVRVSGINCVGVEGRFVPFAGEGGSVGDAATVAVATSVRVAGGKVAVGEAGAGGNINAKNPAQ